MAHAQTKEERIDLRTSREVKDLIQRAADLIGTTMSAFILHCSYDAAREALAQQASVVVSDRDRDLFLRLLDDPPAPNDALKQLLRDA
ncbi:MAG: DUF1778 domain-containing protein [Deltaproteobacteria bacterium]|nr:DUF1778 domain-containing protein [Deltaproteobacteria bacterium]